MKVYFEKTNVGNQAIITDEETAKVFDGEQTDGYYDEEIDLYSDDAIEQLREYFKKLEESGELNSYIDIWSENEISYKDVRDEFEKYAEYVELVLENEYF